jgi:hypothetical protein
MCCVVRQRDGIYRQEPVLLRRFTTVRGTKQSIAFASWRAKNTFVDSTYVSVYKEIRGSKVHLDGALENASRRSVNFWFSKNDGSPALT